MEILLIVILSSLSIAGISIYFFPSAINHYASWQKEKTETSNQVFKRMFVEVNKHRLFWVFSLFPIVLATLVGVISHNLIAVIFGLLGGLFLPTVVVSNLYRRRKVKFAQQFTDALLMFSSSLRAGLSLIQAIEIVATEMPAPLGQEFSLVLKENRMGVGLEDSFRRLSERMEMEELNLFTAAILLARETGGDISTLITRIVDTIRQRNRITSQIKTLTLQGRWQGMIMSILPFVFGFFVIQNNPKFFETMFRYQIGRALLIWAGISLIIGIFLIQKLSKVEI